MLPVPPALRMVGVSLFTREWIEIPPAGFAFVVSASPSLRGSGLKLSDDRQGQVPGNCLPLYEGVD